MKKILLKILFWTLAVIITVGSAYYQRTTGPTYPKKIKLEFNNNYSEFSLPRSGISDEDIMVEVPFMDTANTVNMHYRRFPLNEKFTVINFIQSENKLIAYLPKQDPAGKLEYFLSFENNQTEEKTETEHVVIRFKGYVPNGVLIPHILFIFIAMLFSNLAGILAFVKRERHVLYGNLALIFLLLGGMVFGPIIQKYAFGEFWTGIPFGWDLTDNKTLIAVVFWLVAVISNRKNPKYRYTIIAAIVTLLIFSIPHSLFGSELDYSSGKVVTGFVQLFF